MLNLAVIVSLAYMAQDLMNEARLGLKGIGYKVSRANLAHHAATMMCEVFYLYPQPAPSGAYLSALFLLTEITTPLVNLRWNLYKVGYAGTRLDRFVSIGMLGSWLVFRMTICVHLAWFVSIHALRMDPMRTFMARFLAWLLLLLNSYWLSLMIKLWWQGQRKSKHE